MLRKIRRFFREYRFASLLAVGLGISVGLRLGGLDAASNWVAGIAAVVGLLPLTWQVYQELRIRRFDPDVLTSIATVTALLLREFHVALLLIMAALIRHLLAHSATAYASKSLTALQASAPTSARLLRGRKESAIAVSAVHPGHRLLVLPGEIVPVDGLDPKGNRVVSGTVVTTPLTLRATTAAHHSQLQQRIKMATNALKNQAPITRQAERFAVLFTLLSLALAAAVWYVSGDTQRFLAVLTVAVPSMHILSTELAFTLGLSRAIQRGIFTRSSVALERLALARIFIVDRTAKLTLPDARVEKLPASATPGEKIRLIEAVAQRPVAFVTNQEDDGPALTAADVGIALGNQETGTSAAILITDQKTSLVREAVLLARHTLGRARWSVALGIVLSMLLQVVFATGAFHLMLGIGLQLLTHIAILLFVLRPYKG